jgi:hypothetical protein
MVFLIGILLVILVGGYIAYPLCVKETGQHSPYTKEEVQHVGEEIEREILAVRQHPESKTHED